ncbi:MAG: SLBB domain-containing protein [Candidatus Marinimicrobia bacterium]|nr:SLBB domain-containing protein [Candidatus Neomarinimicrobiota bacterium]
MKKRVCISGLLIFFVSLGAQNLIEEDQKLRTSQDESMFLSTVTGTTPVDRSIDPDEYIVGPGDVFMVQLISDKTITYHLQVSVSDALTIPGVGQVNVKEMDLRSAVDAIEVACKKSKKHTEVNVNLMDVKKIKVSVYGAVENPGMQILPASSRLNEFLHKVRLHHLAKDHEIQIRSDKDTVTVNIYDYYLHGDRENNPYLKTGETIFIPFANASTECVEVYGPVNTKSLVPIVPGETLMEFYHRKIRFSDISDFSGVTITREDDADFFRTVQNDAFRDYVLQPGDILEFARLKQIQVNGYVNRPGTYDYIPDHSVYDYVAMAGGANPQGSNSKIMILRGNDKIRKISDAEVKRGDIILVKRSLEDLN